MKNKSLEIIWDTINQMCPPDSDKQPENSTVIMVDKGVCPYCLHTYVDCECSDFDVLPEEGAQ